MTNEEAIQTIKSISQWEYWQNDTLEAFVLAIKALETGEVYMTGVDYNLYIEGYKDGKRDFEPKQGEWVAQYTNAPFTHYDCSICGNYMTTKFNFCPHCGAEMQKEGAK